MRFHQLLVSSLILLQISFSAVFISEINFIDEEFVEIYSDEILYFNNSKIIDEGLKINSLSKIKNSSSNYSLIIGSSFSNKYNLSNLNCSIYQTDKSQVSNGGLKSNGESFTIIINSSLNLSWIKDDSYEFLINDTLNYNTNLSKYQVSNRSICLENILPIEKINLSINSTNSTTNNMSNPSLPQNPNEQEPQILESYFNILNEDDLKIDKTDEIQFEIFRGDTSKRTIYFHLNKKKIASLEIPKNTKIKGRLFLNFEKEKNILVVSGLDLKNEFEFIREEKNLDSNLNENSISLSSSNKKSSNSISENLEKTKILKLYFKIENLSINSSLIQININQTIENIEGTCYILDYRTKISNDVNISNNSFQKITLTINNSKIRNQSTNQTELKINCKYKNSNLKSYKYESKYFNYTKIIEPISYNLTNKNLSYELNNEILLSSNLDILQNSNITTKLIYESQNETAKNHSTYYILIASISILSLLLFKW